MAIQDKRVAVHEAGHAVAAIAHGRRFQRLSLKKLKEKARASNGQVLESIEGLVLYPEDDATRHAAILRGELGEDEIDIAYGGSIAEAILVGRFDEECRMGRIGDVQNLFVALAVRLDCPVEAVQHRPEWAKLHGEASERGVRMLTAHWPAVEDVAALLMARGRLSYETVVEVVRTRSTTAAQKTDH